MDEEIIQSVSLTTVFEESLYQWEEWNLLSLKHPSSVSCQFGS